MKKTLVAVSTATFLSSTCLAADVSVYGVVDSGVAYSHVDLDNQQRETSSFSLNSGQEAGSRFGFKGQETLQNNVTVGFVLESGINTDTGSNAVTDTFFNREASLYIEGRYGKLGLGRIGSFNQALGSWALIPRISAMGPSFGSYAAHIGNVFSCASYMNNTVAYSSPKFGGFKLFALYNMGSEGMENKSSSDRYYAAAFTYDSSVMALYGAVDSTNYSNAQSSDSDDSLTITFGGSFKFDSSKIYLGVQYFNDVKGSTLGGIIKTDAVRSKYLLEGYSVSLSSETPLFNGIGRVALAFIDAERSDTSVDVNRYVATIAYDYPLSKHTNVYAAVSYMNDKIKDETTWDPVAYTGMLGLRHKF